MLFWLVVVGCSVSLFALRGLWIYAGSYGVHALFRHGGTYWVNVDANSARLSPSMRLARGKTPHVAPGRFAWRRIAGGFEISDLPVMADGQAVDDVLLARINPELFRFELLNASDGDKDIDQWMTHLGAALVVNGSYDAVDGRPDTPFVRQGVPLGPRDYDANAGAFVAGTNFTGVRDLTDLDWKDAFLHARNAMVSYPLLVVDGTTRVARPCRWLANRSFVGQDQDGWVVIGTTQDGVPLMGVEGQGPLP